MSDSEVESIDATNMSWQEFLIELVRYRPCLYDKYCKEYADTRGVKATAWQEVADEMINAGFTSIKGKATGVYVK